MIYAIEAVGSGFIKFGRAKSVGRRLAELETACPFELNIIAAADWPDGAESALHTYLQPALERGEWFKDGPLIREAIAWMLNGQAGLERLQKEMPKSALRRSLSQAEKHIAETEAQRKAQRRAWWKARGTIPDSWVQ
jgi:hypothetical protein